VQAGGLEPVLPSVKRTREACICCAPGTSTDTKTSYSSNKGTGPSSLDQSRHHSRLCSYNKSTACINTKQLGRFSLASTKNLRSRDLCTSLVRC
jgi:hypothetical protein